MNALSLNFTASRTPRPPARPPAASTSAPAARTAVRPACFTMSFLVVIALGRAGLGWSTTCITMPSCRFSQKKFIHVATVLPAIPLGGYVLLAAKKGIRRATGCWARSGWPSMLIHSDFGDLHSRLRGRVQLHPYLCAGNLPCRVKTIATARRRAIFRRTSGNLVFTYLTALMIPGIVAFALPGRLMKRDAAGLSRSPAPLARRRIAA